MEHTKTPWHVQEVRGISDAKGMEIRSAEDEVLLFMRNTSGGLGAVNKLPYEGNAAFIVRAVNSHDALIEALEFQHNFAAKADALYQKTELFKITEAALKLAKGE